MIGDIHWDLLSVDERFLKLADGLSVTLPETRAALLREVEHQISEVNADLEGRGVRTIASEPPFVAAVASELPCVVAARCAAS
jgi:hypothetical protein